MADLLQVQHIRAGYKEAVVLDDIYFTLQAGESLAILGRNGVGKTTLLATLMGMTQQLQGQLLFKGNLLNTFSPYARALLGMGWVPQARHVFTSLTVEENLHVVARRGYFDIARVYQIFPQLAARCHHLSAQLSGGEQQMLAIGRALMVNPSLLLLDEPFEGLAPMLVAQLSDVIRMLLQKTSLAVILVEQKAHIALQLAQSALVLERGRIVLQASSESLLKTPEILSRYLGLTPYAQH